MQCRASYKYCALKGGDKQIFQDINNGACEYNDSWFTSSWNYIAYQPLDRHSNGYRRPGRLF